MYKSIECKFPQLYIATKYYKKRSTFDRGLITKIKRMNFLETQSISVGHSARTFVSVAKKTDQ